MAAPLQLKRGLKGTLPAAAALGEPLVTMDTKELFIGTGVGQPMFKVTDLIFTDTEPVVVVGKIWVDTTTNKLYAPSADGLSWVTASGSAGTVTTDITVYGVTQGSYSDGEVIPAGTSLEDVVKNMLQTVIPPTYAAPTLSIVGSGSTSIEIGTSIAPIITPTFTQRDGGAPVLYTLRKNGAPVLTNPTAIVYNDGSYVITDSAVNYQATQTYDSGPIKDDNQGNAYPVGQILAGTATSNTVSYIGRRKAFYTIDTSSVPADSSALIRAFSQSILNPAAATAFTMNIPAGTTRLVIAYPATIRDISSVKYVELGNGEVKDTFTLTHVNVEGAAGYAAIQYKVFTYLPAVPFSDAVTYQVVI